MHADSLELREQNALIYVEFSLPVSILNDSIRNRLSELFRLADMVTFAEANGRIRISFSVANVWKRRSTAVFILDKSEETVYRI